MPAHKGTRPRKGGGRAATSLTTLVDFLSRPDSYRDRTDRVEVIETHISYVFLTDRHAFKLKKPVQFEFVDFSTPRARRLACEQEVALNRRLAPEVYLGIVWAQRDARGRWSWHLPNDSAEPIVKMRRLPADATLEHQIRYGTLQPSEVDALADRLTQFYREAPPLAIRGEFYRDELRRHVQANASELADARHGLPLDVVRRVHDEQLRMVNEATDLWDSRVCDGRIVEGHGDLRPEHVYFRPSPLVIDAVEFSAELRRVDVVDELCFLAMECSQLNADWVGRRLLARYSQATGDHAPAELLRFYQAYRACVRAKVAALRAAQLRDAAHVDSARNDAGSPSADATGSSRADVDRAATQLALAQRYLSWADMTLVWRATPRMLVVRGLSGTGKSTLARQLAEQLGAELLSTDRLRRELYAGGPKDEFAQGVYAPAARQWVYDEMLERAARRLASGATVVVDGTFGLQRQRDAARRIARATNSEFWMIHCECPPEVAAARVLDRAGRDVPQDSDITPGMLAQQRSEEE
ncbi:MAG TPA: AAA family ATPase, partial [Pirellulaceae bacterium]|nr:AAA family ATPase [Pirellulaceae bacterium]